MKQKKRAARAKAIKKALNKRRNNRSFSKQAAAMVEQNFRAQNKHPSLNPKTREANVEVVQTIGGGAQAVVTKEEAKKLREQGVVE